MAGVRFPTDLEAWRTWHEGRHRLRQLKGRLRPTPPPASVCVARRGDGEPRVVAYVDSTSASTLASLVDPLGHLDEPVAVVSAQPLTELLPGSGWTTASCAVAAVPAGRAVMGAGDYLPMGALGYAAARTAGVPYFVVQHGIMTPLAPPLPREATLLAWSEADAEFWRSGRSDITTAVVGSALLHRAAQRPAGAITDDRPLFLGQLHGAELPRLAMARAATRFCRAEQASYRPHPSERDLASRLQHAWWRRRGVAFDDSGTPLWQLDRPVVSIFSTGVLEAAARGVPSWVYFPRPPTWLSELWDRYDMASWGSPPTRNPVTADDEDPAARLARHLRTR